LLQHFSYGLVGRRARSKDSDDALHRRLPFGFSDVRCTAFTRDAREAVLRSLHFPRGSMSESMVCPPREIVWKYSLSLAISTIMKLRSVSKPTCTRQRLWQIVNALAQRGRLNRERSMRSWRNTRAKRRKTARGRKTAGSVHPSRGRQKAA